MPASPIELKNSLPDLDLNPGRREPSARQASRHCGLISGLISRTGKIVRQCYIYNPWPLSHLKLRPDGELDMCRPYIIIIIQYSRVTTLHFLHCYSAKSPTGTDYQWLYNFVVYCYNWTSPSVHQTIISSTHRDRSDRRRYYLNDKWYKIDHH